MAKRDVDDAVGGLVQDPRGATNARYTGARYERKMATATPVERIARKYRIRLSASDDADAEQAQGRSGAAQVAPAAAEQDDDAERRGGERHAQAEQHRRRHVGVGDHDADGAVGERGEADLEVAAQALPGLAAGGGAGRVGAGGAADGSQRMPCGAASWCREWCRSDAGARWVHYSPPDDAAAAPGARRADGRRAPPPPPPLTRAAPAAARPRPCRGR